MKVIRHKKLCLLQLKRDIIMYYTGLVTVFHSVVLPFLGGLQAYSGSLKT